MSPCYTLLVPGQPRPCVRNKNASDGHFRGPGGVAWRSGYIKTCFVPLSLCQLWVGPAGDGPIWRVPAETADLSENRGAWAELSGEAGGFQSVGFGGDHTCRPLGVVSTSTLFLPLQRPLGVQQIGDGCFRSGHRWMASVELAFLNPVSSRKTRLSNSYREARAATVPSLCTCCVGVQRSCRLVKSHSIQ